MQPTDSSTPSQPKNFPLDLADEACRAGHQWFPVAAVVLDISYRLVGAGTIVFPYTQRTGSFLTTREQQKVSICGLCHLITVEARA